LVGVGEGLLVGGAVGVGDGLGVGVEQIQFMFAVQFGFLQ
jgi:hypothetical protein